MLGKIEINEITRRAAFNLQSATVSDVRDARQGQAHKYRVHVGYWGWLAWHQPHSPCSSSSQRMIQQRHSPFAVPSDFSIFRSLECHSSPTIGVPERRHSRLTRLMNTMRNDRTYLPSVLFYAGPVPRWLLALLAFSCCLEATCTSATGAIPYFS